MKRTPLRQVSAKRAREDYQYRKFVMKYLAFNPWCELGPKISAVDSSYRDCTNWGQGLHHLRKQGQDRSLRMDRDNVLSSCNVCNGWVEDNPTLAHTAGLTVRTGG